MRRTAPALLLVSALLGACGSSSDPACVCTEEFRTYLVTVIDDALQPVDSLTITRTLTRTGQVVEPSWLGMPTPGTYPVADDSQTDVYSSDGDTLRVTGTKNGLPVFSADFVFAVPAPCRCHVEIRAGPDTVVVGG